MAVDITRRNEEQDDERKDVADSDANAQTEFFDEDVADDDADERRADVRQAHVEHDRRRRILTLHTQTYVRACKRSRVCRHNLCEIFRTAQPASLSVPPNDKFTAFFVREVDAVRADTASQPPPPVFVRATSSLASLRKRRSAGS